MRGCSGSRGRSGALTPLRRRRDEDLEGRVVALDRLYSDAAGRYPGRLSDRDTQRIESTLRAARTSLDEGATEDRLFVDRQACKAIKRLIKRRFPEYRRGEERRYPLSRGSSGCGRLRGPLCLFSAERADSSLSSSADSEDSASLLSGSTAFDEVARAAQTDESDASSEGSEDSWSRSSSPPTAYDSFCPSCWTPATVESEEPPSEPRPRPIPSPSPTAVPAPVVVPAVRPAPPAVAASNPPEKSSATAGQWSVGNVLSVCGTVAVTGMGMVGFMGLWFPVTAAGMLGVSTSTAKTLCYLSVASPFVYHRKAVQSDVRRCARAVRSWWSSSWGGSSAVRASARV